MDYGGYLKKTIGNTAQASKHYTKQSQFEGSRRQVRGQILKALLNKALSLPELQDQIADERLADVLAELETEELVTQKRGRYWLAH